MKRIFEIAPKSEQTLKRHNYSWDEYQFVNDLGHPCEYRIHHNGVPTGEMLKYYKGRLLASYVIE